MSRQDARRFVVAYDVANDARRNRIAHVLERYGDRVQYSVFVVDLGVARLLLMKAEITAMMKPDEDSVLLCDLGAADGVEAGRFTYVGRTRAMTSRDTFIV